MTTTKRAPTGKIFLGIDGGGTRTVALLAGENGRVLRRMEAGPSNVKLLTDPQLVAHLRAIARAMPKPDAIGIGLAGAWAETDALRIRKAAAKVWPRVPCHATNDLETALLAAIETTPLPRGLRPRPIAARVLLVSGTGSCCFGKDAKGRCLKIGGWGHMLGDKGSAYEIGLRALKAVVFYLDRDGHWSLLGQRLLRSLQLNEPNDLISWTQSASKMDIASLAVEVFSVANQADPIAKDILDGAVHHLVEQALICAGHLTKGSGRVQFFLAGSTLLKQPQFARRVTEAIRRDRPQSIVTPLRCESVWGGVEFARRLVENNPPGELAADWMEELGKTDLPPVHSTRMSPTEQRNPRSMKLDRLPAAAAISLMISEDARIHRAVLSQSRPLARALELVVRAFKSGGRLFYVGAGTSGRLGVLDAAECPVTFRTSPEMVQAIIAGGQTALWHPVEGAEDNAHAGARAVEFRGVKQGDVVMGIAASGTTRFVWGALQEARRRGARTLLLAFNPHLKIPRSLQPDVCILPDLGPEILTGSTRLKAGTATKLVLNTLTTLAMVRLGKVVSNLMVDVVPTNVKLRDRATRIVEELTGADYATARAALQASGWVIKTAVARLSRKSRPRRA